MVGKDADPVPRRCGFCVDFRNDAAYLEAALPGLASMGSGHAAVRADDGICRRHERYLSSGASCADFAAAGATEAQP